MGGHTARQFTSHLIRQCRRWKTHSTESYCHRIGHQTDDSREHRLKAQPDQDSCRNGHSRTKASHTLKHTTKAPGEQKHQQTLVGSELDELRLNRLDFLCLT